MFKVKWMDIGGDGLVTEGTTNLETLVEVEILAAAVCAKHLGVARCLLEYDEDLIYGVMVNGLEVGQVEIISIG